MTILDKFLEIAKAEIGIKEIHGDNNDKRILEYASTTTLHADCDETAWCSAFVNWCVIRAGINGTNSAAARSWLNWGRAVANPIPGCIVVYKRGTSQHSGHVNFFDHYKNGFIYGCGGNQDDSVCIKAYKPQDVLDFRVPEDYHD